MSGNNNGPDRQSNAGVISAVLQSNKAQALAEEGQFEAALDLYDEAITICPQVNYRGDLLTLRGCLLFGLKEIDRAKSDLVMAVNQGCDFPFQAMRYLAFSYAADGAFEDAAAAMLLARENGEDAAFAAQAISTYRLASGEIEQAELFVAEDMNYQSCDPDAQARVSLVRAELYRLKGNLGGFKRSLDAAANISSEMSPDIALWLAILDEISGRLAPRAIVLKALNDDEDLCARMYRVRTRPDLFEDAMRVASNWEPMNRDEFRQLGYRGAALIAEITGDLTTVRGCYEEAVVDSKMRWLIHHHLAAAALAQMPTL